jgi:hypothetical protein
LTIAVAGAQEEVDTMADFPDVYAETLSITAGPFGCILTFSHILPTGDPGPHADPNEMVARVRLSPAVAKALIEGLQAMMAAAEQGAQGTKTISH